MTPTIAIPPAVCVLPMSEAEFPEWTVPELQARFFLGATDDDARNLLALAHPGRYLFRKHALDEDKAPPGTLVLFQYKAHIIASAVLARIERYANASESDENRGAFWFIPESVRVFKPLAVDVIQRVWPGEIEGFSNVRYYLNPPANFLRLYSMLRGVAAPVPKFTLPNEAS